MTAPTINSALQSLSIAGVSAFMGDVQVGWIASPNAALAFTAIGAAVDGFFGSVTKHPLTELQAVIHGLPATGNVSPKQQARIMPLLGDHQATVDHVLRMTARFDAGSEEIAGAANVVALQAPFDLGAQWRWIPPGKFQMGSADDDPHASSNEMSLRTVMTSGFYMLNRPVTNAEFKAFLKAMGCEDERDLKSEFAGDYQPAIYVTHNQATAYSELLGKLLGEQTGVSIIGKLPTEAEWEKAAKGPGGSEFVSPATHEQAHFNAAATRAVNHPDVYKNGFGLIDIEGNVWEWTSSTWKEGSSSIVLHGGSWYYDYPDNLRAAFRFTLPPRQSLLYDFGFRPVLVPQG